eukprot:3585024-Alexandrium_andersonii.AAC.1
MLLSKDASYRAAPTDPLEAPFRAQERCKKSWPDSIACSVGRSHGQTGVRDTEVMGGMGTQESDGLFVSASAPSDLQNAPRAWVLGPHGGHALWGPRRRGPQIAWEF